MSTLVQKVRFAVGAENDDFFRDATIIEYLNRSQDNVISRLIKLEEELKGGRGVRGLDGLRDVVEKTTFSAPTATNNYQITEVDLSADQVKEILYVGFLDDGSPIRIKELDSGQLMLLDWGNITPSKHEGYYYVKGSDIFELYTADAPVDNTDKLQVHVIKNPTPIVIDTTFLANLPDHLENAVVYGAAQMMAIQEQRETTANFTALFEEEMTLNAY